MTVPSGPVVFNADTGSDTGSSGLGPDTPIVGTVGVTSSSSTLSSLTITSGGTWSDISVGDLVYVTTSSGRKFSIVSGVTSTDITTDDNWDVTETASFYIGGKRATLEHADSRVLFNTQIEYLRIEIQTDQVINSNIEWIYGNRGGVDTGPSMIYGVGNPAPVIEQTANDYHFYRPSGGSVYGGGGNAVSFRNLKFTNSNASKTYASVFYFILNYPYMHFYECTFGDSTNPLGTTVAYNTGSPRIHFDKCVWDSSVYPALRGSPPPFSNTSSSGLQLWKVRNCLFKDCYAGMLSTGTVSGSNGLDVSHSIFTGCEYALRNDDVYNNGSFVNATHCVFHNNTTAIYGLRHPSSVHLVSNIFSQNTTAISFPGDTQNYSLKYFSNNAYYDNGTTYDLSANAAEASIPIDEINLSADPFVNAAGGDFRINKTVGGGSVLRSAGYTRGA